VTASKLVLDPNPQIIPIKSTPDRPQPMPNTSTYQEKLNERRKSRKRKYYPRNYQDLLKIINSSQLLFTKKLHYSTFEIKARTHTQKKHHS